MANFSPKDYGNIGLAYANWQNMIGMSDKTPFGFAEDQAVPPVAPVAPYTNPDVAMAKPDYSVAPIKLPTAFGVAPTNTFGVAPVQGTVMPTMSLEDSIKKSFED